MSASERALAALDTYRHHGAELDRKTGNERHGASPFNDKAKFYANVKTGEWHDKVLGAGGHVAEFLQRISEQYVEALTLALVRTLAKDRKLPPDAFDAFEFGHDGAAYTVTVRDAANRVVDIRRYALTAGTRRMMSTKGCNVGLLGAHLLSQSTDPVYICEGEWDAVALQWLLRRVKKPGVVLSVPGVGTFKEEWAKWFAGRDVHVLFDHDDPGREGEQRVHRLLRGVAKSLTFTHWPKDKPTGYDARDLICTLAIKKQKPKACWKRLCSFFQSEPRLGASEEAAASAQAILSELKKEWVYCYEIKRYVYLGTGTNGKRSFYELDKESFSDKYAEEFPNGKEGNASRMMLETGCTKVSRPAYLPNQPQLTTERVSGTELPVVNLWIPSDVDTSKAGNVGRYLKHLKYVIPDEAVRQTVLDSFAFWCRYPEKKTNWAIFLGGQAGIGKDLLVYPVAETLGRSNYGTPTPQDLESGYTDWLKHRKLVVIDTIRFRGKQELMERLKPWIASPPDRLRINGKFAIVYEIANLVAFVFMANRRDALALDPDDRRFFVYWSNAKPKSADYYRDLWDWTRANVGAIGHYFLHHHAISKTHSPLTPPPMTAAKLEMIAANEPLLLQFLRAAWDECREPLQRELVVISDIVEFFNKHHSRLRDTSPHAIGNALRELGAEKLKQRLQLSDGRPHVWAMTHGDTYAVMKDRALTAEYHRQQALGSYRTSEKPKLRLVVKP